ncbi:hypothetical protein C8Q74DRAFT_255436 [Fomes fomentarius]|nr:hypothetical protein C8Q74DRAFT_255436 [Fomes fomentarius]
MTPYGSKVVLGVRQGIPSVTVSDQSRHTSGYIDWTAIMTSPGIVELLLYRHDMGKLRSEDSTFFVSEAKDHDQYLEDHVPQAVCEMLRYARTVGKTTIRGVLADGRRWIFLILILNNNGGGTYRLSSGITVHSTTGELERKAVSLLGSIIADRVCLTACLSKPGSVADASFARTR